MPESWVRERKRDYYYRRAKEEKFRSRATYKLQQAVEKYHFLKRGDIVIDLGAAPGGWLQACRKIVGSEGFILGVDIKEIRSLEEDNIHTIVGDITNPETTRKIERILTSSVDVIISDVSPNISGVWEVDHARQIDLTLESLAVALQFLKTGGNFFVKVFHGDMFQDFVEKVKQHFARIEMIKPKASRARSAEIFILGIGLKKGR